jgi:hypothetical protein
LFPILPSAVGFCTSSGSGVPCWIILGTAISCSQGDCTRWVRGSSWKTPLESGFAHNCLSVEVGGVYVAPSWALIFKFEWQPGQQPLRIQREVSYINTPPPLSPVFLFSTAFWSRRHFRAISHK